MKFLKKILISMTIVLVLFSAIRNNTTVVKNNEVHADAIAALPILAANPELIPIFALGFFVLVTCKLAADNYENILAVGNEVANAIKAAGKSVSDFVNAQGQIVMNEAFKNIVKSTVDNVSKGEIKHTVNYNSTVLNAEMTEGITDLSKYEFEKLSGSNKLYGEWEKTFFNVRGRGFRVDGKTLSSLTYKYDGVITGFHHAWYDTPRLRISFDTPAWHGSEIVKLSGLTPAYLQYLFSVGILLDVQHSSDGKVLGFEITILPEFLKAFGGTGITSISVLAPTVKKDEEKAFDYNFDPQNNGRLSLNRLPFEAIASKTRSVNYTASLFTGAIDLKSVEKSLDIAFPGTNDTLIPLDNVLKNPNADVKDLKGLDAVLKNPNKFLDDDKRNKLDDVYKNAGTLDLKGIDNVSDKSKFNIKDYALDKTKVSDKDTPTDKPLEGEHEKGTFSDIPILGLLGRLWDWLKEFAQQLIKAIADGVTSIVNAIDKLFDLIDKILDFLVVDVLVGDLDSFKTNFNNMQKTLHSKFPDITPLNLSFSDKDGFDDFTADLPLVGHQVIIKGSFMNQFARPARAFFSGLFYFLTGLFFFRKFHKVSEG